MPYQVFEASDGHFILAVGNDSLWNSLVDVLDVEALRDRKFKTNPDRVQNRDELISILEEIFKRKARDEWVDMLESAKIPCGPVNKLSDILNDAHIKEREMVVEMEHPSLGILKMLGVPVKLSRTPGRIKTVPPAQGEHSETVLKQMGYSKEEIETFIKEGIIIPQQKCV